MAEKEYAVVTGAVESIEIKPKGRFAVKVRKNVDDQYTVSLNTKDTEVISVLQGAIGQMYTFNCGISEWEYQGQPVKSKWINEFAPVGTTLPTVIESPTQQAVQSYGQAEPHKSASIAFQSMAKGLAVECFRNLPEDQRTVENAVKIADFWAAEALARGQYGLAGSALPKTPEPQSIAADNEPPALTDDDIPF